MSNGKVYFYLANLQYLDRRIAVCLLHFRTGSTGGSAIQRRDEQFALLARITPWAKEIEMQCKIPAIGIASLNIVHYATGRNFKYNNGMPIRCGIDASDIDRT
jgi:hypothetical protein